MGLDKPCSKISSIPMTVPTQVVAKTVSMLPFVKCFHAAILLYVQRYVLVAGSCLIFKCDIFQTYIPFKAALH